MASGQNISPQPIKYGSKLDGRLPSPDQTNSSPRPIGLGEGGRYIQSAQHRPLD